MGRNPAIDIARGLIVALMALDHTRLFFSSAQFDPVAVAHTNLAYFATRWVTHLCAPGFFFLAGLGVSLAERAGQDGRRSTILLASRGFWLVLLEFTLIGFAWSFNLGWSWFGVICSLGASMVCLAALRWVPKPLLLVAAGAFLVLHNLIPMDKAITDGNLRAILYSAGAAEIPGLGSKIVIFPLLPWLAIMVLGFAGGEWLTPERAPSVRRLAIVGTLSIAAFVVLRASGFGQPSGDEVHGYPDWPHALMSFMNVEKYPPSLQYVLATLGALFVIVAGVALLDFKRKALQALFEPPRVFGRVPFFFYVVHLFVIHLLALLSARVLGWPNDYLFWSGAPNFVPPPGFGVELWGVYLAWLVVLALLFPACFVFARAKDASRAWWTKYL